MRHDFHPEKPGCRQGGVPSTDLRWRSAGPPALEQAIKTRIREYKSRQQDASLRTSQVWFADFCGKSGAIIALNKSRRTCASRLNGIHHSTKLNNLIISQVGEVDPLHLSFIITTVPTFVEQDQ